MDDFCVLEENIRHVRDSVTVTLRANQSLINNEKHTCRYQNPCLNGRGGIRRQPARLTSGQSRGVNL